MTEKQEPNHPREHLGMRELLLLIAFGIVLFLVLSNVTGLFHAVLYVLDMLTPLWIAVGMAFALNLLVRLFEGKVFAFMKKRGERAARAARSLSIACSFLAVILFLTLLIGFLIPQIVASGEKLVSSLPALTQNFTRFAEEMLAKYNLSDTFLDRVFGNWQGIVSKLGAFISTSAPKLLDFTGKFAGGIMDSIMGLMMAVYLLFDRERYIRLAKKLVYAFAPRKWAEKAIYVGGLVNKSFTDFISGQLTEALILGFLCFLGMTIFRFPYALLIGFLIGVTGIIPVLGAYIGIIPSFFIILMIDPIKALWFIVFIIVLQQIEGNLIYPKVVGKSIGLGGFWVIMAIVIGGSLGGVVGMFLGVPTMAVIYIVGKNMLNRRLKARNIVVK